MTSNQFDLPASFLNKQYLEENAEKFGQRYSGMFIAVADATFIGVDHNRHVLQAVVQRLGYDLSRVTIEPVNRRPQARAS